MADSRSHPKTSFIWSGWLENSSFSAQAAGDAEHWKGYSQDRTRYVRDFGMTSKQFCPLCAMATVNKFYTDQFRDYFLCKTCHLVFVPPTQFLSPKEEKSRYDLHKNFPDDQNYRQFLNRLFLPMKNRLSPKSHGLDFGAGPGPTLSVMFEEIGHSVNIYDYFYAADTSVFEKQYDFITSTEVVEHLHNPKKELDRLWNCLKPKASLGVMTKLVLNREAFINWHYKNDPTHVCFFSKATFKWIAKQWSARVEFIDHDVIIFFKDE